MLRVIIGKKNRIFAENHPHEQVDIDDMPGRLRSRPDGNLGSGGLRDKKFFRPLIFTVIVIIVVVVAIVVALNPWKKTSAASHTDSPADTGGFLQSVTGQGL